MQARGLGHRWHPERTLREDWRRWGLAAYQVGRATRFRDRDLEAHLQANRIA